MEPPLLRLTAISTAVPMPDNRTPDDLQVYGGWEPMTELTLSEGDAITLSTRVYPLGLFPDAEISWTVSDPEALKLDPSPDGRYCRMEALKAVSGGVTVTAEFEGVLTQVEVYLLPSALSPTPAP